MLTLNARLSRPHLSASLEQTVYLLIQVQAPEVAGAAHPPLNVAAVADRSGSMSGPPLAYTKQALQFLITQLSPRDRLAVVAYDDEVITPLASQRVQHKDLLKARVAGITEGGSTNLGGGMIEGYRQIRPHAASGTVSRVLLMTDGHANHGVTDPATLTAWARSHRQEGLTLSTLGVGDGFNEDLLTALAEAGGGRFHYIPNPDAIPAIFAAELDGLLSVAAQGLQLRAETGAGAQIAGVLGYPPTWTDRAVELTLPDIYSQETKSILLALQLSPGLAAGADLARLTLEFMPATPGARFTRLELTVPAPVTENPELLAAPDDPEVMREVHLARATEALEQAVAMADAGDLQGSAAVLSAAAAPLAAFAPGDAYVAEQVQQLREQHDRLASHHYDAAARKKMRAQSHTTRQGRRTP